MKNEGIGKTTFFILLKIQSTHSEMKGNFS